MLRIRTANAHPPKEVRLVFSAINALVVEYLADFDAAIDQLFARCLDIGNDEVHALRRSGRCCGNVLSKNDREAGTGWRELDDAEVVVIREFGVESPSKPRVELFCAIKIRNGDHHDLKLHVDRLDF